MNSQRKALGLYSQHFIFSVTNRPIKVECFMKLGWKGLPKTNTLAYLGPFVSYKGVVNMFPKDNSLIYFDQLPFVRPGNTN